MDYLSKKFNSIKDIFLKAPEPVKARTCTRTEFYFDQAYRILNWDDVSSTLIVFLLCNFIFWLIVYYEIRLLGMVFRLLLFMVIYDAYFESKDLSTYNIKYASNICSYIQDGMSNLMVLRKENPSWFCLTVSFTFFLLSCIARNISGYVLTYLTLLGVFFVPLGFSILPEEHRDYIRTILNSLRGARSVLPEEELIPMISNIDLENLLNDKTQDSATNSFASSISAMPSYLEDNDENDLAPNKPMMSLTPADLSTDSDSDSKDIHFDSAHFIESSSDEERQLAEGLRFRSKEDSAETSGLGNVLNFGSSFVTNVLKAAISSGQAERKNSSGSSDSEFEIINPDEVK